MSGTVLLILGLQWILIGGDQGCDQIYSQNFTNSSKWIPIESDGSCALGYIKDGEKCFDDNECCQDALYCGNNANCFNTFGRYYCKCNDGYHNIKGEKRPCFLFDKGLCQDINECLNNSSICGDTAKCQNTIGNYRCNCLPGYRDFNTSTSKCTDIDECTEGALVQANNVCGLNGSCVNFNGGYHCDCPSGYTNYGHNRTKCSELKCDQFIVNSSLPGLSNIVSWMRTSCLALTNPAAPNDEKTDGVTLLETLLNATEDILSPGQLNNSQEVSGMLGTVENALKLIAPQLKDIHTKRETSHAVMEFTVWREETPPTGPIHLTTDGASLHTNWRTATGSEPYTGVAAVALVNYKNLEKYVNCSFEQLPRYQKNGLSPSYRIFSKVVSVVVSNPSTEHLNESVTLTFRHLQNRKESAEVNYTCVYWKPGLNDQGAWSTGGCSKRLSNATHTECSCSHLSSFAVLMALYPMEEPFELVLFTKLGLTISLLCLAVSILTFMFCRSIKGTRTTIHLHLCVCLFIANFIFLIGISQTDHQVLCRTMAALLHFFYLGAFSWMLLEGVQLYRMLVLVFNATMQPRYLYATGYGIPLVIVFISIISRTDGYGTNRHCWLSLDHGLIWSFFGPVCLIILLNILFFIITIWKLIQKFSSLNQELSDLRKIKVFTVTAIAQLCVLGLTWVSGVFLFQKDAIIAAYIFTILNSLQGVLIFFMHCLLSQQVREEYARFFPCLSETQQKKRYSELSNTIPSSHSGSHSGRHTQESQI